MSNAADRSTEGARLQIDNNYKNIRAVFTKFLDLLSSGGSVEFSDKTERLLEHSASLYTLRDGPIGAQKCTKRIVPGADTRTEENEIILKLGIGKEGERQRHCSSFIIAVYFLFMMEGCNPPSSFFLLFHSLFTSLLTPAAASAATATSRTNSSQ